MKIYFLFSILYLANINIINNLILSVGQTTSVTTYGYNKKKTAILNEDI